MTTPAPIAWRWRRFYGLLANQPGAWTYTDGPNRPTLALPGNADIEPLYAAPSEPEREALLAVEYAANYGGDFETKGEFVYDFGTLVLDTTPHRDATTDRVNTGVSDLFFNNEQACEAYRLDPDDQDRTNRMRDAAEAMQSALRAAGIVPPTVDALWRDFERRL